MSGKNYSFLMLLLKTKSNYSHPELFDYYVHMLSCPTTNYSKHEYFDAHHHAITNSGFNGK